MASYSGSRNTLRCAWLSAVSRQPSAVSRGPSCQPSAI